MDDVAMDQCDTTQDNVLVKGIERLFVQIQGGLLLW